MDGLDMVAIATGYGCPARRVESADRLRPELTAALTADGPMLLNVPVADPGSFRL
ncbi:thiamine pyrophosphate-dependent enzyme [Streptosporangium sp. NPDC000396]|uniref:thiamine pyrophosphate-dependent enzyme n=1 Tax=Streptosporangium sp. NPDC000396 TaxID=3366185 RepID=UPI00368FCE50